MVIDKNSKSVTLRHFDAMEIEQGIAMFASGAPITHLQISSDLGKRQVGAEAALLQLIITWAQRESFRVLVTDIDNPSDPELTRRLFTRTEYGMVAALLADTCLSASFAPLPNARELALKELQLRERPSSIPRRGSKVLLLCADHTSYAYPSLIYGPTSRKLDFSNFRYLASTLLRHIIGADELRIPASFQENIATILFELVQNTHEWARTTASNRVLDRSVRGLRIEMHSPRRNNPQAESATVVGWEQYIRREGGARGYLEISVFDSGPGLAARYMNHDLQPKLSIEDELEIVLKCLKLHGTSSGRTDKGVGLHRLLQTLTRQNGCLRLRTGRLSLWRDFEGSPYDGDNPFMVDAATGNRAPSKMAEVAGTLLTMLVPLSLSEAAQPTLW